jgi:hypothetical protein
MTDDLFEFLDEDDIPEPIFNLNSPEHVIINVIGEDEAKLYIEEAHVLWCANNDVVGAATYEDQYGGFLDYTIAAMIDMPTKEGWYVVENVTGKFIKGDGWMTDDDMEFYFENLRPATQEEIDSVL